MLELGGVEPVAREWTAWLLAVLVVVHGASLAWRGVSKDEDGGLRLPKWPLAALPIVIFFGLAWWWDDQSPSSARETFFLAMETWLICWVVAATPGGRALSWAWLIVVGATALLPLVAAIGWQSLGDGLWLPLGRSLPAAWRWRWSGTLPIPGAFGGMMVLAGPPILVLAFSSRLPWMWRILCGYMGLLLLCGAVCSFALGAWLGVILVVVMLPIVAGCSSVVRLLGWIAGAGFLATMWFLPLRTGGSAASTTTLLEALQVGEPRFHDTWTALKLAWQNNPWLGGNGASVASLMFAAGVPSPVGGWRYGFGDWTELALVWGLAGLGLALLALGGLLGSAWLSWAKLPFQVPARTLSGWSGDSGRLSSPKPTLHSPEAKILLGAAALGTSAMAATMLASRTLNVPVVAFAFAIMTGVLARTIPQRGGFWRIEPVPRAILSLGVAAVVAFVLAWRAAPAARAQQELDHAGLILDQIANNPDYLSAQPVVLKDCEAQLRLAEEDDSSSAEAWNGLAWLDLEEARSDPAHFQQLSEMAEDSARRALAVAPRAPEAWVVHGVACLVDDHPNQAENDLRQALAIAPFDPQVQYYAVAVLGLDFSDRITALKIIEAASVPAVSPRQVRRLQLAYTWAVLSMPSIEVDRARLLPPLYRPAPAWPPVAGLPAGSGAAAGPP